MWIMVAGSVFITVILMLLIFAATQKRRNKELKSKEESALRCIAAGIGIIKNIKKALVASAFCTFAAGAFFWCCNFSAYKKLNNSDF